MAKPPFAIGHNGPPVFESAADIPNDVPRMHFFMCDIDALWDAIIEMPFFEGGFYLRALVAMYKHGEGLPADDNVARMRLGGVDIRTYRRMKKYLIDKKCFIVKPSGRVSNARFEEEITKYVVEYQNRQRAGLATAEKQRVARASRPTSGRLPADFRPTSDELPRNFRPTSEELNPNIKRDLSEKDNEINGGTTAIAVQLLPEPAPQPERKSDANLDKKIRREEKEGNLNTHPHTTRMPRTAEPDRPAEDVWVRRPGEEEVQPGLFVNCDTIRHRGFTISIASVAMQLATANLGLSRNEATPLARDASIAHALQWAAEIEAGRRVDIPKHPANFIKGSVIAQRNREAAHQNAMAKPTPPPAWRGSGPPKSTRNGSYRPTPSELAAAVEELEGRANPATIDGQFERIIR